MQHLAPKRRNDHQIEKALDYIERSDCRLIGEKILAYLLSRSFGSLMRGFQKREHHQREISFELFLRLLRNCRPGSCLDSIQSFHRFDRSIGYNLFYFHVLYSFNGYKDSARWEQKEQIHLFFCRIAAYIGLLSKIVQGECRAKRTNGFSRKLMRADLNVNNESFVGNHIPISSVSG